MNVFIFKIIVSESICIQNQNAYFVLAVPLCVLIVGRDVAIMSAVAYLRFKTVPKPVCLNIFLFCLVGTPAFRFVCPFVVNITT